MALGVPDQRRTTIVLPRIRDDIVEVERLAPKGAAGGLGDARDYGLGDRLNLGIGQGFVARLQTHGDGDGLFAFGYALAFIDVEQRHGINQHPLGILHRPDQIASGNFFVGAGEEGLAAADTITDAGALASKDLIGFQCAEGTPTSIDFVYRCAGQAAQQVKVGAGTAAAATWVKLGWIYLPNNPTTKKIIAYVDNVEVGTFITSTNLAAATFPLDQALSPLFGVKNSTTVAKKLKADWWAAFQQFAD